MTDSGFASDKLASTGETETAPTTGQTYQNAGEDTSNYGPTAGYDNNVDRSEGTEKKSTMDKIKEKLLPNGPGKTDASSHDVKHSATFSQGEGHAQANADLNRE